jgi:predicted peptidase
LERRQEPAGPLKKAYCIAFICQEPVAKTPGLRTVAVHPSRDSNMTFSDPTDGASAQQAFESHAICFTGGSYRDETFGYRLLKPPAATTETLYPLVLFLHGAGERGKDNEVQLKYLPTWMTAPENRQRFPCYLIAPQCRPDTYWVETPRAFDREAPRQPPGPQMQVVLNVLEEVLVNHPIDPQRLYLTGLSMGGYGSWDLGTRWADRWAAVAPICGGGDELYADRLVHVPVWAWHGDRDDVVPVDKSRTMIEAIRSAGGSPKYTELKGVGHDSWTEAYTAADGLLPWMFAQRKQA